MPSPTLLSTASRLLHIELLSPPTLTLPFQFSATPTKYCGERNSIRVTFTEAFNTYTQVGCKICNFIPLCGYIDTSESMQNTQSDRQTVTLLQNVNILSNCSRQQVISEGHCIYSNILLENSPRPTTWKTVKYRQSHNATTISNERKSKKHCNECITEIQWIHKVYRKQTDYNK